MRDHSFTEEQLKALAATGTPYALYEAKTPGFCVRVTAHGTATYCYRSTLRGGRSRTVKIARVGAIPLKAARARALELKVQMTSGIDPAAQVASTPPADVVTLQDLLDYWLANTTATAKTKKENARVIRQWLQSWLARDIRSISKKDVVGRYKHVLVEVRKTGRPGVVTANRTMNAMRSCWKFWMNTVEGGELPCPTRVLEPKKRGGVRESTERVQCELTADGWRQWGAEMRALDPTYRAFCELHLFAGLRTQRCQPGLNSISSSASSPQLCIVGSTISGVRQALTTASPVARTVTPRVDSRPSPPSPDASSRNCRRAYYMPMSARATSRRSGGRSAQTPLRLS